MEIMNKFSHDMSVDRTVMNTQHDVSGHEEGSILYDPFSLSKKATMARLNEKKPETGIPRKKHGYPTDLAILEYERYLAAAEDRYRSDVYKMMQAVVKNRQVSTIGIVRLIFKLRPIVRVAQKQTTRAYWERWRAITERKKRSYPAAILAKMIRIWIYSIRINMLSAFCKFNENGRSYFIAKARNKSETGATDYLLRQSPESIPMKTTLKVNPFANRNIKESVKLEFKKAIKKRK